ncbi:MAG: hypothetical protein QUS11_00335 [Candidatus Fermentibacter sp.]|nr:hypothetical protein [Candidatus Fermentibacter sp.]
MSGQGSMCGMDQLLDGVCPGNVISSDRRARLYARLLEESRRAGNMPRVVVETDEDDLSILAVTATDWPGLAAICLSAMQFHGWNLDFAEAFAVSDGEMRRGFLITGIRDTNPERRREFGADSLKMQSLLENLAEGRSDTMSLMARASERLEIYERIKTQVKVHYKDRPVPEALMGPVGELILFVSSRSDEYLRERRPEDLAHMVVTNHDLIEGVRARRGRALFKIRNIRTTREHLTGINIAGYERDISFQDSLTALSFAWPGATIRHQRRYTTGDGIISIRVEMSGPSGLAASREEIRRMTDTLRRLLVKNELERLKKIRRYGGREHYARALIPLLLKECDTTGMSQAYIALDSSSTFFAELKILLVTAADGMEDHDRKVLALVGAIDRLAGMAVVSFKSPSNYGQKWVDLLDVTVQKDAYHDLEDAYEAIKRCMEETIGQFRDFDMGMRLNDVKQLREIRDILPDIPDSAVTDFYYCLEDFLRASSPVEELGLHIRLAFETLSDALRTGGDCVPPTSAVVVTEGKKVATLFCCILPEHAHTFQDLLDTVKEYKVTASLIDWSGLHSVLLRVHDRSGALSDADSARVLGILTGVCRRIPSSD